MKGQELEAAYLDGSYDMTWWCTQCHLRDGETEDQARSRIGALEEQRIDRLATLKKGGWTPPGLRQHQ